MSWLMAAAARVNPGGGGPGGGTLALHAITRLELANNELRAVPAALFSLLSLRLVPPRQVFLRQKKKVVSPAKFH